MGQETTAMRLSWVHVAATAVITGLGVAATDYPHAGWIPLVSAMVGVVGTIGVSSISQAIPKEGTSQ